MEVHSLLVAADCGDLESVQKLLLSKESDVNVQNSRVNGNPSFNPLGAPIHYAARSGHEDIVQLLIKFGADLNILDIEDWTPLHYACYNGHSKIAKYLLENAAKTNIEDNYLHKTALEFAKYRQFGDTVAQFGEHKDWKRTTDDILKEYKKRKEILTEDNKFLHRYKVDRKRAMVNRIKEFRSNISLPDIKLEAEDTCLGEKVILRLSHDSKSHLEELESLRKSGKRFYRASSHSTCEHLLVIPLK